MSHKASCSTTHNSHGEASFNPKMYDVFLSFRGKDTRTGFVRDLSGALKTARVHTFIDSKTLRKGDVIGHTLKEAIKNSRICIPVFSKNFAESKWCLEEVSHMLKSENGRICPLFYDVTPSDVRHPDEGMFAKAFIDHSNGGKINKDSITQWKRDLENVSSRSGWSLDQVSGDEKQLIWLVLADVKKELGKVELDIDPKRCIGLETPIREVVELLNLRSERVNAEKPVRTVGIDGMGGVGKTTLAKAVYKKIYSQFKKACLVLDVRERAQKDGLCKLQKQILKDLTVVKHEVKHVEHGKSLINDRLRATKLLLVLDNVDGFSADQLEALLGKRNFGAGSRVLITTRDRHVLNLAHVAHECIYHVNPLSASQSLELFSWRAFMRPYPDPEFETLSKNIVNECEGLPLALEVLGSLLMDKRDASEWSDVLNRLVLLPLNDIEGKLRISFDSLNSQEKQIFLDIACFFIWTEKEKALIFWEALELGGSFALRNLLLKNLIGFTHRDEFVMHALLRNMGR